mmetsp:Transcript_6118/g.7543  ORF Transcript_6118/g.7543 Transcript_6118/m.7543 type:complete len:771 (-) Transcript_6118:30-2342(-)
MKIMETLATELGLTWIFCNISDSHYIERNDGSSKWHHKALLSGVRTMEELLRLSSNCPEKLPITFYSVPIATGGVNPAFLSFLAAFLSVHFNKSISEALQYAPKTFTEDESEIEKINRYVEGVKTIEARKECGRNGKNKIQRHLSKSYTIVVGNTFCKDTERELYNWSVYLRRKPLANENIRGDGLWFIHKVEFKIPSNETEPVIIKRSPYCFDSHSWGTLIIEIIIHFRPRCSKEPMCIEYELDFSAQNKEQYFVIDLSRINPATRLDIRRRKGWKASLQNKGKQTCKSQTVEKPAAFDSGAIVSNKDTEDRKVLPSSLKGMGNLQLNVEQPRGSVSLFSQLKKLKNTAEMENDYSKLDKEPLSIESTDEYQTGSDSGSYVMHPFINDTESDYDGDMEEFELNIETLNEEEFELTDEEIQILTKSFRQFDLEDFASIFVDNHVRLDCLAFINEEDLTLMGVDSAVHKDLLLALRQISQFGAMNEFSIMNTGSSSTNGVLYREIPYNEIEMEPRPFSAGFYGVVYRGIWRGQYVAVKKVKAVLDKSATEEFRREAAIMERLNNHPAIAFFIGICTEPEHLCMITKYYPKGSAYDVFIGENLHIENKYKVKLLVEAASGLLHIHREGLVHCDVAARNILIDSDWSGKICDFGLSRVLKRAIPKADPSLSGPLRWMAPELLLDSGKHSPQSDTWSFGVTIWEIIHQKKPYFELSRSEVKDFVISGNTLRTDSCSPSLKSIMDDCFRFEADQRPSMTQIWKRLNDYYKSITLQ